MVPVKSYGASTSTSVSPCCGVKSPDLTTWGVRLKGKAGRFPQTAVRTPVYRGMTAEDPQHTRSSAKGNTVEEGWPWLNPSTVSSAPRGEPAALAISIPQPPCCGMYSLWRTAWFQGQRSQALQNFSRQYNYSLPGVTSPPSSADCILVLKRLRWLLWSGPPSLKGNEYSKPRPRIKFFFFSCRDNRCSF